MRARRQTRPSTRHNKTTTTTTTMYATSATRCVTRPSEIIFSSHASTSRDERGVPTPMGQNGRVPTMERAFGVLLERRPDRTDGWMDTRPTPAFCPRRHSFFSFLSRGYNYPRFNRQLLGVDRASPTPTTRRMVGLTRVNPSLFSLDAALSPPGRPTVKVRRMPIRDVATRGFCTREKTTAHRVVFGARIRAFARRLGGGILDDFGWMRRRPLL